MIILLQYLFSSIYISTAIFKVVYIQGGQIKRSTLFWGFPVIFEPYVQGFLSDFVLILCPNQISQRIKFNNNQKYPAMPDTDRRLAAVDSI